MKQGMLIFALIVVTSSANMAESPAKQPPIWDVTLTGNGHDVKGKSMFGKLYVIQTSDTEFRVLDPISHSQTAVKKDSDKLKFQFSPRAGDLWVPAELNGFSSKSIVSGHGYLGNQSVEWKANRLVSLWVCSNHNPRHAASGEQDMQQLTKDHKCEGWHRLANPQTDVLWVNTQPGQSKE